MPPKARSNTGHLYGVHRVIAPDDVLPLDATVLDANSSTFDNEIELTVHYISLHPEYLRSLFAESGNDSERVAQTLLQRLQRHGKLVTTPEQRSLLGQAGCGAGYAVGVVSDIGSDYHPVKGVKPELGETLLVEGDLASLPLQVESISNIQFQNGTVFLKGKTYLSPTVGYIKIDPVGEEMEGLDFEAQNRLVTTLFLPLQWANRRQVIEKAAKKARKILVLGSSREALLCGAIARKTSIFSAIYGFDTHVGNLSGLQQNGVFDVVGIGQVDDAVTVLDGALKMTGDELVDLVIHATYEPRSALSAVLPVKDQGMVVTVTSTTPRQAVELAALSVNRSVEVLEGNVGFVGMLTYQENAQYFAQLLNQYTALNVVL